MMSIETRCSSCGIDMRNVFPPGTVVVDLRRDRARGEVIEWTNDNGRYSGVVQYNDANINKSKFRPEQFAQRFEKFDMEEDVDTTPSKNLWGAVQTESGKWVGTTRSLEEITKEFNTLKALRKEFDSPRSHGVGEDENGNKIYQLILKPEGMND